MTLRMIIATALLATACGGDDPVSVSAPVGLSMKTKSDDVKAGDTISEEKNINTESGNPWGAFVSDVEAELGGPPGDLELDSLVVLLAATSDGVTELRQVFGGQVDIQFQLDDGGNVFMVGSGLIDDGVEGREVALESSFDYGAVAGADRDKLLSGGFKVVLGGPAAAGFAALGASADFQLTLAFSAYE